ncbi:MAG: molybdopterin-dependent oxidoreductase [Myxococcales bacterium]|nr:molybdopterin-dependent oxidoreductase [Myxococcales bacterium]
MKTTYRVCTLCEATCGIAVDVQDGKVTKIAGDASDPFSRGYICPKAFGMKGLQEDPDRLRTPLIKNTDGTFRVAGWDEAIDFALSGLNRVRQQYGNDSLATYAGNPNAHSLHAMIYGPVLTKALQTKHRYSASSADQLPKMISCGLMFGGGLTVPIPDLDKTKYLLMLGANPMVSNGSLMTAPGIKHRLRAIRERGGKVVVVDPRRTETCAEAHEHLPIRPGTDAAFVLALVNVVLQDGAAQFERLAGVTLGLSEVTQAIGAFTPAKVSAFCGIPEAVIVRVAREFAAADCAACYGRIGTTCQEFGTLASWAIDVLNIVTGNLDREGGVMFPLPAAARGGNRLDTDGPGRGTKFGRWTSSVRGLWEAFGELPVSVLAEEILDAEESQRVRGMVTVAGNPLLSAPGTNRLEAAFASLEFMVSVDIYLNETTRHADVILPPPPPLERESYDLVFYQLSVRNIAKFSPAVLPRAPGVLDEWEILLSLATGLMGGRMPLKQADDFLLAQLISQEISGNNLRFAGLESKAVRKELGEQPGPQRVLDLFLRLGPYGDGFGQRPEGLNLEKLKADEHGRDLGPLQPRLPGVLNTKSGKIELWSELISAEVERHAQALDASREAKLRLIGRRHLRSNNSWMHNVHALAKGPERCTLLMHPADAERLGLQTGDKTTLRSRVGSLSVLVEVSDEIMEGVVSMPHGWGHIAQGTRQGVASERPGANVNMLSDPEFLDVSGNAAFNGVPVEVLTE